MEQKTGMCEVGLSATINLNNFESVKINVGFSEPYDASIEGHREMKYYDLLEFTQARLMELADETGKTLKVIKKEKLIALNP